MIKKLKISILFLQLFIFNTIVANNSSCPFTFTTDRYCYVSGQNALISIIFPAAKSNGFGKAVYVDMVTADSQFVNYQVYNFKHGSASGYFPIVDTLTSGFYYLRVYTDQSKNSNMPVLSSKKIYVTNRFGKNEPLYNYNNRLPDSSHYSKNIVTNNYLKLALAADTFTTRQKVKLMFSNKNLTPDSIVWASVSVKPLSGAERVVQQTNKTINKMPELVNPDIFSTTEMGQGVRLYGRLVNQTSNLPLANTVVLLSFQDTLLRLKYDITDTLGRFCFFLSDFYGLQKAFLNAYSVQTMLPVAGADFIIDGQQLPVTEKSKPQNIVGFLTGFDTINVQKSVIEKIFDTRYFEPVRQTLRDTNFFEHRFIVDNITSVVTPANYIPLPNFVEISREILPFVKLRKSDNGYTFSVVDGLNKTLRQNPVVFVDGVPVRYFDNLLKLSSKDIKRVEVKSQPRFWGDIYFENGIIFIWTQKQNFWLQNAKQNAFAVDIKTYQQPVSFKFADYSKGRGNNEPDFRPVLYYNSLITVNGKNQNSVEFFTSDETGIFEIIVEGQTNTGNPVYLQQYFTVQ